MTADNPAQEAQGLTEDPSVDRRRDLRARCDAIFREHNDALVRAVYSRLHSWEEATEIVQEATALTEGEAASVLGQWLPSTAKTPPV